MPASTTARARFDQRLAELSLHELTRSGLQPTRTRSDLEVEVEVEVDIEIEPDTDPEIEEFVTTLRMERAALSRVWFDAPEDVIALVGEPELPEPHPLRIPLLLVAIAAVAVTSFIAIGLGTGLLAL
ncbi:MAG: hypothetical protein H6Q90_2433 [Deltaproteobacteria bacterium]|nr:hypothetical protein [Deltaproteobacteria bacterium]